MTKQKFKGVVKRGSCAFFALVMASALSVPAASLQALAAESDLDTTLSTQDNESGDVANKDASDSQEQGDGQGAAGSAESGETQEEAISDDQAMAEAFEVLFMWAADDGNGGTLTPNQIPSTAKGVMGEVYMRLTDDQIACVKKMDFWKKGQNALRDPGSYVGKATVNDREAAVAALEKWSSNSASGINATTIKSAADKTIEFINDASRLSQAMAAAFSYLVGWVSDTADRPKDISPAYKGVLNEVYNMDSAQASYLEDAVKQEFQNFQGQQTGLADFSVSVTTTARDEMKDAVTTWAAGVDGSENDKSWAAAAADRIASKLEAANEAANKAMADAFANLVSWVSTDNVDDAYKGALNEVYAMLSEDERNLLEESTTSAFQLLQGTENGLADFSASVTVEARSKMAEEAAR